MQLEGFIEVSSILRSGVYALCAKGQVIYVGKSKAMIARIGAHRQAWIAKRKGRAGWISETLGIPAVLCDEVHILPCPVHALDDLEAEMINRFKPRLNAQLKTTVKVSVPIAISIAGKALQLNASTQRVVIERRI